MRHLSLGIETVLLKRYLDVVTVVVGFVRVPS